MADLSIIAWTHHTFNPWMGCLKVSPGCAHCYAETLTKNRMGLNLWGPAATATRQVTSDAYWRKPFSWAKDARNGIAARHPKTGEITYLKPGERARVFSGSLCDVFEDHPVANATRPRLFELIRSTPELDWLLLTKRPENIAYMAPWGIERAAMTIAGLERHGPNPFSGQSYNQVHRQLTRPWPNVWLGTSIENRDYCWRRDELVKTPAVVHFISAEPLLEDIAMPSACPVCLESPCSHHHASAGKPALNLEHIEWLIVGGESGPGYRPMDLDWARNLRSACADAGTAFFFKQSAAFRTEMGIELDGKLVREYPAIDLPVMQ